MKQVNIHEAKTHFSALISEAQNGEEIVIARAGQPVARLVPVAPLAAKGRLGWAEGEKYWIADDFDEFVPPGFKEYL